MVMSKKEQEMLSEALLKADIAMSLRWTPIVKPDIEIPTTKDCITTGWLYNVASRKAYEVWSSSNTHGDMPYMPRYGRKNGKALYSTKALALAAMRNEIEWQFAAELLSIDKKIIDA